MRLILKIHYNNEIEMIIEIKLVCIINEGCKLFSDIIYNINGIIDDNMCYLFYHLIINNILEFQQNFQEVGKRMLRLKEHPTTLSKSSILYIFIKACDTL